MPAVEAIRAAGIDLTISIDTFKASVADAALAAGAHAINDCSGLSDPDLARVVAKHDAALVVMHLKGELNVRDPAGYAYADVMREIIDFLRERTEAALAAGVRRDAIVIDPGLEFGKEPRTDLEILDRFGELRELGYPILFASSRKSFIGRIFRRPAKELLGAVARDRRHRHQPPAPACCACTTWRRRCSWPGCSPRSRPAGGRRSTWPTICRGRLQGNSAPPAAV